MNEPTNEEFRAAGYTGEARMYPLSPEAFRLKCERNGTTPEKAPRAWAYAPNEYVRRQCEKEAHG